MKVAAALWTRRPGSSPTTQNSAHFKYPPSNTALKHSPQTQPLNTGMDVRSVGQAFGPASLASARLGVPATLQVTGGEQKLAAQSRSPAPHDILISDAK